MVSKVFHSAVSSGTEYRDHNVELSNIKPPTTIQHTIVPNTSSQLQASDNSSVRQSIGASHSIANISNQANRSRILKPVAVKPDNPIARQNSVSLYSLHNAPRFPVITAKTVFGDTTNIPNNTSQKSTPWIVSRKRSGFTSGSSDLRTDNTVVKRSSDVNTGQSKRRKTNNGTAVKNDMRKDQISNKKKTRQYLQTRDGSHVAARQRHSIRRARSIAQDEEAKYEGVKRILSSLGQLDSPLFDARRLSIRPLLSRQIAAKQKEKKVVTKPVITQAVLDFPRQSLSTSENLQSIKNTEATENQERLAQEALKDQNANAVKPKEQVIVNNAFGAQLALSVLSVKPTSEADTQISKPMETVTEAKRLESVVSKPVFPAFDAKEATTTI